MLSISLRFCSMVCRPRTTKEGTSIPKRRANGEGNIRKRKDGRWEGRYTAGHDPITGKQIFKNVLGKTQAEVKDKLNTALEELKRIDVIVSDQMTTGEWLDTWLEHYAKPVMRATTYNNYETLIRLHIKPYIGEVKLNKLTTLQIQKLYNKLLSDGRFDRPEARDKPKGLSSKTVRNIHTVIHSACEKAIVERLLAVNPTKGCRLPKKERTEMKVLPPEKLADFFREAKETGVFELYYLDLSTGLRRGELLGLKWSDIDFEKRTLEVKRQIQRVNGVIQETAPKTNNAYRKILLSSETIEILKAYKEQQTIQSEYVFPSPTGEIMEPDSARKMLKRVLQRAGSDELRFHDLRHTFATLALQNGVDVKTLSGILGHYSAGFTLDTYAHVTTQMQEEAANKMGDFLQQVI